MKYIYVDPAKESNDWQKSASSLLTFIINTTRKVSPPLPSPVFLFNLKHQKSTPSSTPCLFVFSERQKHLKQQRKKGKKNSTKKSTHFTEQIRTSPRLYLQQNSASPHSHQPSRRGQKIQQVLDTRRESRIQKWQKTPPPTRKLNGLQKTRRGFYLYVYRPRSGSMSTLALSELLPQFVVVVKCERLKLTRPNFLSFSDEV